MHVLDVSPQVVLAREGPFISAALDRACILGGGRTGHHLAFTMQSALMLASGEMSGIVALDFG